MDGHGDSPMNGSEGETDSTASHLMVTASAVLLLELVWIAYSFLSWWREEMNPW